jgi:hypothetical protein
MLQNQLSKVQTINGVTETAPAPAVNAQLPTLSEMLQKLYEELSKVCGSLDKKNLRKLPLKKRCGGGYMYRLYTDDDPNEEVRDFEWICRDWVPRDFLTLVRFIIAHKCSRDAGMHTRCILSGNGDFIYMVLKVDPQSIFVEAQKTKLTKQIELGYADLFSLEPCDEKMRPLRLKRELRDAILAFKQEPENIVKIKDSKWDNVDLIENR